MQEFYVSIVRFCAMILEILLKIYVTEFSYRSYHGSKCISAISATFSASEDKNADIFFGIFGVGWSLEERWMRLYGILIAGI